MRHLKPANIDEWGFNEKHIACRQRRKATQVVQTESESSDEDEAMPLLFGRRLEPAMQQSIPGGNESDSSVNDKVTQQLTNTEDSQIVIVRLKRARSNSSPSNSDDNVP